MAEATIDELDLDLNNPRFAGLSNQRAALEKIVTTQGVKLVNLAEDIVTQGLSPAHRMLVMKSKTSSRYVVMDGNRRLAALRVLRNPAVLDGMKAVGDVSSQKLRKLAKTFSPSVVEPIDVHVCESEEEARHWIEAIHTGENEGRGVVGWDGEATARYRGKSSSIRVLDFVKAAGKLTPDELATLQEKFPITNLDRLLGTPEVRERLGLSLESGELLTDLPQGELAKSLKRVVLDLAKKVVTVSNIKQHADRLAYLKNLGADLPDLSKRTGLLEPIEKLSAQASAKALAKASSTTTSRSLLDRRALIPPQAQCPLNITNQKLQQLCKDLRKLPLETYPVSIAAIFRIFLELSLDHYGAEKTVAGYNRDLALKRKIEMVADHLTNAGVHKRDLQAFRSLASNSHKTLSVDQLHAVVHGRFALPTANELRAGWAEVQVAFIKIWE